MATVTKDDLIEVEALIREGNGLRAKTELGKILSAKIPRKYISAVASLARRANMAEQGIRLLNPIVRFSMRKATEPTATELSQYAACLIRIGASEEGLEILSALDPKDTPEVELYRAFGLFSQWRYSESIPILFSYLQNSGLDAYSRFLGEVNLASALIFERRFEALQDLLPRLVAETERQKLFLLNGNALELTAQQQILLKNRSHAEEALSRAQKALSHTGTRDEYYVRKWKAIVEIVFDGPTTGATSTVEGARSEARERRLWESVRQLDRYVAVYWDNASLVTRLYFGTPYEGFRRRLLAELPFEPAIPDTFVWTTGGESASSFVLEISRGQIHKKGKSSGLTPHDRVYRLLSALASDFYRPLRLAELHFRLYPGEYYNPISAPNRVHQAINRFRVWVEENTLPLSIIEDQGTYRLEILKDCGLRVVRSELPDQAENLPLKLLQRKWSCSTFSAPEAGRLLGLSSRTILRILTGAMEAGVIYRTGNTRAVRYGFLEPPRKKESA